MHITATITINSSREQVWTAITDITQWQSMIGGIIDLTVLHQPQEGLVGLKWAETRHVFGKESTETMWITEVKEREFYCTRAENCGAIYVTKMSLNEVDGQTQLTMSFSGSADGVVMKLMTSLMSLFIKKSMLKLIEQDLRDIKAYIEKA